MESFKNSNYGSSDAADALVKLGITACFLPGITLQSPLVNATTSGSPRIVGLAHTVEFVLATNTSAQSLPPGSPHHVDCAPNGSVIVSPSTD